MIDITDLDIGLETPHPKWGGDIIAIALPTASGSFEGQGDLFFRSKDGLESHLHLDESEAAGIEERDQWIKSLEEEVKRRICKSAGIDYSEDAFGLLLFPTDSDGKIILINPENVL